MTLRDFIPAAWRRKVYAAFALIGLALTSVQVAFSAADTGQPVWLTVAFAVYGLWAGAVGFTALSNAPDTLDPVEIPDGDGKRRLVGDE